jgi:hypothetical protein
VRRLYAAAGVRRVPVCWLVTEAGWEGADGGSGNGNKEESFLEVLNGLLATGEVPGLFTREQTRGMAAELGPAFRAAMLEEGGGGGGGGRGGGGGGGGGAGGGEGEQRHQQQQQQQQQQQGQPPAAVAEATAESLRAFLVDGVRAHLHVVLALSPRAAAFAPRARRFPALFAACVADWYLPWPEAALAEVAGACLEGWVLPRAELGLRLEEGGEEGGEGKEGAAAAAAAAELVPVLACDEGERAALVSHMGAVHVGVVRLCAAYRAQTKRCADSTPKSFLSFVAAYRAAYGAALARARRAQARVSVGLRKLAAGAADVAALRAVLGAQQAVVADASAAAGRKLAEVEAAQRAGEAVRLKVAAIVARNTAVSARIGADKDAALADFEAARPWQEAADAAITALDEKSVRDLQVRRYFLARLLLLPRDSLLYSPPPTFLLTVRPSARRVGPPPAGHVQEVAAAVHQVPAGVPRRAARPAGAEGPVRPRCAHRSQHRSQGQCQRQQRQAAVRRLAGEVLRVCGAMARPGRVLGGGVAGAHDGQRVPGGAALIRRGGRRQGPHERRDGGAALALSRAASQTRYRRRRRRCRLSRRHFSRLCSRGWRGDRGQRRRRRRRR